MNFIKYRPDIDGLRALAVVPVVLFHFGLGCSGGYVGVDVFFVISGYLITRLILKGVQAGEFSILEFWERRIRRIFPALYVMVFASVVAGYFLLLPWDYEELGRAVTMQSLFSSNFHFWSQSGYFDGPAEMKPLLHTWSLAVEEQFYFIFPALLSLLFKRCRQYLYIILCVICVLSFIASFVGVYHYPYATFYLLPMRAWELFCGALLALRLKRSDGVGGVHQIAALLGVSMIVFACVSFDSSTRFPGAAALLPCLGSVLFIWSNEGGMTLMGRLFSLRPIVFVGLISYSLYLWHWPLVAYMNRILSGEPDLMMTLGMIALSFVLAVLSWRYVERPFRKGNLFKRRSSVFKFGAIFSLVAIAVGGVLDGVDGAPGRVPESVMEMAEPKRNKKFKHKATVEELKNDELLIVGPEEDTLPVKYLLWGDSHAGAIAPALESWANTGGNRIAMALRDGTPPLLGVWLNHKDAGRSVIPYSEAVVDYVREHEIEAVLMAARWRKYVNVESDDELEWVLIPAENNEVKIDRVLAVFEESIARTVDEIIAAGARVYILKQVPNHNVDVPRKIADKLWRNKNPMGIGVTLGEHLAYQAPIDKILDAIQSKDVVVLDASSYLFEENGGARVYHEGNSLYRDEDHLSDAGAELIMPELLKAFKGSTEN